MTKTQKKEKKGLFDRVCTFAVTPTRVVIREAIKGVKEGLEKTEETKERICPQCSQVLTEKAKFCSQCGKALD